MKNIMTSEPNYFGTVQRRKDWCHAHHFLPVYDLRSQPQAEGIVYPQTQFICTATFTPEVYADYKRTGQRPTRKTANLLPTAFLFEADGISIKEQVANIRAEAYKHILSVTYSGGKSLHVLVPILAEDARLIEGDSQVFKEVWQYAASLLFKDIAVLDERCATIGRLSRMPGATRYPIKADGALDLDAANCKDQKCVYLNDAPQWLRINDKIAAIRRRQTAQHFAAQRRAHYAAKRNQFEAPQSAAEEIAHLRRSAAKYPTPAKQVALLVLDEGKTPTSEDLPKGGDYYATFTLLVNRFPKLAAMYYDAVREAHPSRFPETYDKAVARLTV